MNNRFIGILLLLATMVVGVVIYLNQDGTQTSFFERFKEKTSILFPKDSDGNTDNQPSTSTIFRKALIGGNSLVMAQTIVQSLKENGNPNLQPNMEHYQKAIASYNAGNYSEAIGYLTKVNTGELDIFSAVLLENSKVLTDNSEFVEIAVAGPMTGDSAQKGFAELSGAALAQQEINRNGGISGKKVVLDIADDKGQAGQPTVDVAKELVNSKVLAVVGHIGSSNTLAAAPIYEQAGLPAVSPSSSSPLVSSAGEYIFRVCPDDNAQGRALAKYAKEIGGKKTAIVFMPSDAYSQTLHDSIQKEANVLGLVVAGEYEYSKEAMDFSSIASQIKSSGVDSVFFSGTDVEGAYFLIDLKKVAPNIRVLAGDGMYIHRLLEVAGSSSNGLITTTFYHAKAGFPFQAHFTNAFSERFKGTPNARSALAYDALYAITNALNDTQQFSRQGVLKGLKSVSFQGATGRIKFNEYGDAINKPVIILETKNLEYTPVKAVYE